MRDGTRWCVRLAMGVLGVTLTIGAAFGAPADRVWVNGRFYTVDPRRPSAEALAERGGVIAAVGSRAEIEGHIGEGTRVVDLDGRTALPGLIDAHGHVIGLGRFGMGRMDFSEARSFEEVVRRVSVRAKEAREGEWIVGGRWDHESWSSKALPTHGELSEATPGRPVWLRRVDGHAGLANSEAMRRAGVTRETPDPPGGAILRDAGGEPTGIFVDGAMSLIDRVAPDDEATTAELILKAQEMCFAVGLTGVHEPGVSPAEIGVYRELARAGRLKLRVYAMVSGPYAMRYFSENPVEIGEWLTVRSAKLYMDGAMGSRGAWLLAPYEDRPLGEDGKAYTGLAVSEPGVIFEIAEHALEHGYQVCTHAIGDRGNREALDAYERALRETPTKDHRFRVEHAQLLAASDIPRFAALGVIASMQPTHCTSDMRWVEARVGKERARGAYAWRSLLNAGARLAGGSDFPVESHNPFLGFHAAVTRQSAAGEPEGGWLPEERLTREEALRLFTIDAAYASFEEPVKGSLEVGKYADFIVIDRDVMLCEAREIVGTRVLRTVVGGETVFELK